MINFEKLLECIKKQELTELNLAGNQLVEVNSKRRFQIGRFQLLFREQNQQIALSIGWKGSHAQGFLQSWNMQSLSYIGQVKTPIEHVVAAIQLTNGSLAVSDGTNHLIVWDRIKGIQQRKEISRKQIQADTPNSLSEEITYPEGVIALATLSDNQFFSASSKNNTIYLWDAHKPLPLRSFGYDLETTIGIQALATAPDHKTLVSAGRDHIVRIWDIASGICQYSFHASVIKFIFKANGELLGLSNNGIVYHWDIKQQLCLKSWQANTNISNDFALVDDEHVAIAAHSCAILLDVATGICTTLDQRLAGNHYDRILALPNDYLLISNSYPSLEVYALTRKPLNTTQIQQVLQALQQNTSVKTLNLSGLALQDAQTIQLLKDLVAKRKDFTAMNLDSTGIESIVKDEILAQLPLLKPVQEPEPVLPPPDTIKQHPYVIELEQRLADYTARLDTNQQQLAEQQAKSEALEQQLSRQEQALQSLQTHLQGQVDTLAGQLPLLIQQKDATLVAMQDRLDEYETLFSRSKKKEVVQSIKTAETYSELKPLLARADFTILHGLSLLRFRDEITDNKVEIWCAKGLIVTLESLFAAVDVCCQYQAPLVDKAEKNFARHVLLAIRELRQMEALPERLAQESWQRGLPSLITAIAEDKLVIDEVLAKELTQLRIAATQAYKQGKCTDTDFYEQLERLLNQALMGAINSAQPTVLKPSLTQIRQALEQLYKEGCLPLVYEQAVDHYHQQELQQAEKILTALLYPQLRLGFFPTHAAANVAAIDEEQANVEKHQQYQA